MSNFKQDCHPYSREILEHMCTRQLLKELRNTYSYGCPYSWTNDDWLDLDAYQATIKSILATREHIPNKKESKRIRKAKIKKGV